MAKYDIQMIAVDLDGTLLNEKHQLSERNREAVKAAIAQGVKVILATGKTRRSARDLIQTLGLTTPGVFVQGCILYNADGSVRHETALDPVLLRRIITYADERGYCIVAYSGDRILLKRADSRADHLTEYGEGPLEAVGPLYNLIGQTPLHKLIIIGNDERMAKSLRWQLNAQMDGQVHLTMSAISHQVEVLPAGISKGKSVLVLAKDLAIDAKRILAIGDGENDLEMVQAAGVGVAMGNADARLKQVARYTVASNQQDGVAEAIERFVLPPKEVVAPAPAPTAPAAPAPSAEAPAPSTAPNSDTPAE